MVEGKQTRPSDPEELIRLSAKLELLPCYYCGREGKLHEVNVCENVIFVCVKCEKCGRVAMHRGAKLEYVRKPFHTEKSLTSVPIKDAKERCALRWNFRPEILGPSKIDEITSRREWKEWIR